MGYIVLGALGFMLAYIAEHPRVKSRRAMGGLMALLAYSTMVFSVVKVAAHPVRFAFPPAVYFPAWFFFSVFTGLFAYSVLMEIPLKQRRHSKAHLVTSGTYALTRHPGVIWATLAMVFLILASGVKLLLVGASVWVFMDIIWVWLQEKYLAQTYPEYENYKMEVPMLIPTRSSIRRCFYTWKGG